MATAYWKNATTEKHSGFLQAGHTPTLFAAFLYFDLSFMVWVLLGPLAPEIARTLSLSPAEKGLMVATPTLAGAILRVVVGVLVDRIGPKRSGAISQSSSSPACWSPGRSGSTASRARWCWRHLGLRRGELRRRPAAGLRWYPPEHQGTALGIAGAGNSGTVLAALFAPALAMAFGWTQRDRPGRHPADRRLRAVPAVRQGQPQRAAAPKSSPPISRCCKTADAWWLMASTASPSAASSASPSSLTIYFTRPIRADPGRRRLLHRRLRVCRLAGPAVGRRGRRPRRRGADADGALCGRGGAFALVAAGLPTVDLARCRCSSWACSALGMGNGAVFQLVPQRFRNEIGVMTGLVGMTGGVGGFYLASSLGFSKQLTGSYRPGFLIFASLAVLRARRPRPGQAPGERAGGAAAGAGSTRQASEQTHEHRRIAR